jgi:HPt (histidine-containing phosphotransfer) domain-containing protein
MQTNDIALELILKELLTEITLSTDPNITKLQLSIAETAIEPSLVILTVNKDILDFLKVPLTKDSFNQRLKFWTKPYAGRNLIECTTLLQLIKYIELEQTRKIFDSFVLSSEKKFIIIKKALADNDFKQLFEATHYLKTSAGIVGAYPLLQFCEIAIEKTKVKEQWTPYFLQNFLELELLFQQTIQSFRP